MLYAVYVGVEILIFIMVLLNGIHEGILIIG